MNIRNLAIAFSIFVGIGMLATWTILFATGNVPEMQTGPFEATFLLLAELITAGLNLLAAYGMLRRLNWGIALELIALGALLYCAIYSIGVFGQQKNLPATIFFVTISLLDTAISGGMISQFTKNHPSDFQNLHNKIPYQMQKEQIR